MKGIMFNERFGLETATIKGDKKRTFREAPGKLVDKYWDWREYVDNICSCGEETRTEMINEYLQKRPPYKIGEIVAIKQSYETVLDNISKNESVEKANYFSKIVNSYDHKGDELFCYSCEETIKGWRNKMFVKNNLMPLRIKITNVHVERLHDISEEDCLKEGIYSAIQENNVRIFYLHDDTDKVFPTAKEAFAYLIDKISGKGTWKRNPWGWVIEYELVKD